MARDPILTASHYNEASDQVAVLDAISHAIQRLVAEARRQAAAYQELAPHLEELAGVMEAARVDCIDTVMAELREACDDWEERDATYSDEQWRRLLRSVGWPR